MNFEEDIVQPITSWKRIQIHEQMEGMFLRQEYL